MTTRTSTTTSTTSSISSRQTTLDSNCRDMIGQENTCQYFSSPQYNYCNKTVYLSGVLFSVVCKLSCNLCNQITTAVKTSSTSTLTLTSPKTTGSNLNCQNLDGQDSTCVYFSSPQYNYCNKTVYLSGVIFSQACKRSCNLCNTAIATTTTTRPTTTAVNQNCQDFLGQENNCIFFSAPQYNYCNKTVYLSGVLFSVACKLSCKLCTSATTIITTTTRTIQSTAACVDTSPSCLSWANFCYILANLATNPCPKTCKLC